MDWQLSRDDREQATLIEMGHFALEYSCRHTPAERVIFFVARTHDIEAQESTITLVGRDPRPTPSIAQLVANALGEIDLYYYLHALDCRSRGFGIGALVYMRRVVENEMDRLLDIIIETLGEDDQALRETLASLKGSRQFSEKAAVADARLPPSFFPGSQNPFARLHDLTSEGVHILDDVESCQRFDECRELFEMLFEKLLRDRDTKRLYRERLTSLKRKSL